MGVVKWWQRVCEKKKNKAKIGVVSAKEGLKEGQKRLPESDGQKMTRMNDPQKRGKDQKGEHDTQALSYF